MKSKSLLLLMVLALVMAVAVQAQDELSGEITVSFWGNVDEYEQGLSDNRPWEATYNLIKEWDEMHENVTVTFISQPVDGIYDRRLKLNRVHTPGIKRASRTRPGNFEGAANLLQRRVNGMEDAGRVVT